MLNKIMKTVFASRPQTNTCWLSMATIALAIVCCITGAQALADEPDKATVVCFGDSITNRGYYETLGHLLDVQTINAGVPGHSTAKGLKRISKDVLDHQPDVVVIFFGTNDLRVDAPEIYVPVNQYTANLETMIEECSKIDARVVLCTLPPIKQNAFFTRHNKKDFDAAGGLEKLLQDYRTAAQTVAAKRDVPVVDLNELLRQEPEWLSKDGVHPSPEGNSILAKHIAKVVAPLLPSKAAESASQTDDQYEADIIVYGATSSGVMAAIQAARLNKSVMLLEPKTHIGGLTTGALGATDIGNKGVIGGLSREFYRRVAQHYADDAAWTKETREEFFANRSKRTTLKDVSGEDATMWTFEPHVAQAIFAKMLEEAGVSVRLRQTVAEVRKAGSRVTEIETVDYNIYRGKMFIDATYEGDLMAKAGVSYRVGREANAEYDETLNGIRDETPKNQIYDNVDPYIVPGDPSSGLIPLIQPGDGGTPGDGDHRVQAYNFRLCFTNVAANRRKLDPPANYDPGVYELAARRAEKIVEKGIEPELSHFCNPVWMPNFKTDINNSQGISTDFIGANYDYPDADYKTRAKIWAAHEDYVRGFWYFMSTNERIPVGLREQFLEFGPCKDEFPETNGFSPQMYVREARRMKSGYVMTEHNCRSKTIAPDSIAMAAYGMDSHNCQRIVQNGAARNEGDVQKHGLRPYPISYRSIVPQQDECENLLVPVCVSATHIAFGSIRMEPVFMVLGQSSAAAASLAIDQDAAVQELEYEKLRSLLWALDQVLKR